MRKSLTLAMGPLGVLLLAALAHGSAAHGFQKEGALQKRRVVMRGRLTHSPDLQQVVTWQTRAPRNATSPYRVAHLGVETAGPRSRILWQTDGGGSFYEVRPVEVRDLNGDGTPEIVSLWRAGASAGGRLRVFHWDAGSATFAELHSDSAIDGVDDFRVVRGRVVVHGRSGADAFYEVRGSELVRAGGAAVITQEESGVEGRAEIGPTRPGPIRLGESPAVAPYETTIVIHRVSDGQEVARVRTGSDGRFRVTLPPGEYRVGPESAGKTLPRGREEAITVQPGQFTRVTIRFDSGIR